MRIIEKYIRNFKTLYAKASPYITKVNFYLTPRPHVKSHDWSATTPGEHAQWGG